MRLILAIIILLLSFQCANVFADSIRDYIQNGKNALSQNKPKEACTYFEKAISYQNISNSDKFVALIGVGKCAMWLTDYKKAYYAYKDALALAQNDTDKQVASIGLASAQNALDYPQKALKFAKPFALDDLQARNELIKSYLAQDAAYKCLYYTSYETNDNTKLSNHYNRLKSDCLFETSKQLSGSFYYSYDSDNLNIMSEQLGVSFPVISENTFNRIYAISKFSTVWDNSARFNIQNISLQDRMVIGNSNYANIKLGLSKTGNWNFFDGSADWFSQINDNFGLGASYEHSNILTINAINAHTVYNSYSLVFLARPFEHIYIKPSFFHQSFSDDNIRNGGMLRLIISPYDIYNTNFAIGAELLERRYHASLPYSGLYFSPQDYRQEMAILHLVYSINPDWKINLKGGFGRQLIDNTTSNNIYNVSFMLSSKLSKNAQLGVNFTRDSIATLTGGGSNYWNNSFLVDLIIAF